MNAESSIALSEELVQHREKVVHNDAAFNRKEDQIHSAEGGSFETVVV